MDVAQFRHAIRIDIKGQLIDFFVEPDLDPLVIDRLLKARKHGCDLCPSTKHKNAFTCWKKGHFAICQVCISLIQTHKPCSSCDNDWKTGANLTTYKHVRSGVMTVQALFEKVCDLLNITFNEETWVVDYAVRVYTLRLKKLGPGLEKSLATKQAKIEKKTDKARGEKLARKKDQSSGVAQEKAQEAKKSEEALLEDVKKQNKANARTMRAAITKQAAIAADEARVAMYEASAAEVENREPVEDRESAE